MRLRLCCDQLCGDSGKEILTGALALAHTLEDGQTKLLDLPLVQYVCKTSQTLRSRLNNRNKVKQLCNHYLYIHILL